MNRALPIVAIVLVLAWSSPASAQVSWKGLYAGADVSVGFKTLDFSVTDGYFRRTFSGAVDPRVNIAGHGGFDLPIKRRLLVGGEAGFGYLGYYGEMFYGPAKDTTATTKGGPAWTAMGRVGWIFGRAQAMPYFAAGVMGSKNTATIVDACSTAPCGREVGEGSGSTTATHWVLAYGLQVGSTKRIAGRGWAVRVDWVQLAPDPIVNEFTRTATSPFLPPGYTVPNTTTTNLSRGMLRLMFDIRLTK